MYKIVYERHKPLSEATQDPALAPFDAVLDRALAKDRAQRFPSALAMRSVLLALAGDGLPDALPAELVLPALLKSSTDAQPDGLQGAPPPSRPFPRSMPPLPPSPVSAGRSLPVTGQLSQASIPVPTGWDAGALAEIERELALHIGPVARVLVRRAARASGSPGAVRHAVASSIVDFEARERFLAKARGPRTGVAIAGTVAETVAEGPGSTAGTPVTGGVPMRDGDVDKAAAALLPSLGPISRVVARRCAADSQTREQFVARVLEQLTPSVDARRVQAELWRAFG